MDDNNEECATLYVGDLLPRVTEKILFQKFENYGNIVSVRVCRDKETKTSLGYGYVNFEQKRDAKAAKDRLNFNNICGKPCRIMWYEKDPSKRKSGVGNIVIKNLDRNFTTRDVHDLFSEYGEVTSCKLKTDHRGESMGCAFVNYEEVECAEEAIAVMDQTRLGDCIVTVEKFMKKEKKVKSGMTTCYVEGCPPDFDDEVLRLIFEKHGEVMLRADGSSRCLGFVDFKEAKAALGAVRHLNGKVLRDCEMHVYQVTEQRKNATVGVPNVPSPFNRASAETAFVRVADAQSHYGRNLAGGPLTVPPPSLLFSQPLLRAPWPYFHASFTQPPMNAAWFPRFMAPPPAVDPRIRLLEQMLPSLGRSCGDKAQSAMTELMGLAGDGESLRERVEDVAEDGRLPIGREEDGRLPIGREEGRTPIGREATNETKEEEDSNSSDTESSYSSANDSSVASVMANDEDYGRKGRREEVVHQDLKMEPRKVPKEIMKAKQILGEKIYPLVSRHAGEMAGKITGMLLELDLAELICMSANEDLLRKKIEEAMTALNVQLKMEAEEGAIDTTYETKQLMGEKIFPLVSRHAGEMAGKITGMFLELDLAELLYMIENEDSLRMKIEEAMAVINRHNME